MTDDLSHIPRPRRTRPTRRQSLKDRAQELADLDEQNLTLYGLSTIPGAPVTKSQLISSTRKFFKDIAAREKKRRGKAKKRCI